MPDKTYLQWPFFEQHHRDRANSLDSFARKELLGIASSAHANPETMDDACRELVSKLAQAGFLDCCTVQESGQSFDVRSICLSRETLAFHSGLIDFAFAMQGLGSGPISLAGNDEQRAEYLPAVARGEKIAAFALSEPNAGSDVGAMTTTAQEVDGEYVLNGTKTWISNGGLADFYTLFARTGEQPGARGLSAFIVDANNPGLKVVERIPVIAPHPLATIKLSDCRVPKSAMIGTGGQGFKIAMATLDVFRTSVGAASLGFARRALHEALGYSKERIAFGKAISEFQLTQAKLAEMATSVDTSALLVYRSAWSKDTLGGRNTLPSAMAKMHATEEAQQVIDKAVQLFGGKGVVTGEVVESLYREIRALRIYEGTTEVQKLVIASHLE